MGLYEAETGEEGARRIVTPQKVDQDGEVKGSTAGRKICYCHSLCNFRRQLGLLWLISLTLYASILGLYNM